MIDFQEANALIDADTNRHRRKNKATVMIGVTHPYKRYIWLEREVPGFITVTLLGNKIATITREGHYLTSCGYFTPTTRLAMETLVGRMVTMQTPGSRGGGPGEAKGFCHGKEIPSYGALFVPAKEVAALPPDRCTPENIEATLAALRILLYDAAGLSGDRVDKDLRIAQVIGNLGDCYHMEDKHYIEWVQNNCD